MIRIYERTTGHLRNRFDAENNAIFVEHPNRRKPLREALIKRCHQAVNAWLHYDSETLLDIVEVTVVRGKEIRRVL